MGKLIEDLITRILEEIDLNTLRIKALSKGFRFTCTMLDDESCGLCFSVFNQEPLDSVECIKTASSVMDLDIGKVLQFAGNEEINIEKVLGISVLNAVSQHIIKNKMDQYNLLFDGDPIEHIQFNSPDKVVMVGYIGGIFQKLQRQIQNITIIDDRLKNIQSPTFNTLESSQSCLNQADVVLITGSTIVNNTLETVLSWIMNAREIILVGPSAGIIPDSLFDRNVTMVSGMQVLNPLKVLQIIAEDGGTPHFKNYCRKYNIFRK
ncbi:MAG TPA: DUF364 domain-containing protein [Candidatus Deferrimicrobium sp.]|nr:DUF364 domain-containing protein [Candidatus Deferrimicrobium sp.]